MGYPQFRFLVCLVFTTFVLLVLTPAKAEATTYVSGPLVTNTTWQLSQSPVVVGEAFVVPLNVTLTIKAGVVVKFDPSVAVRPLILGKIVADGTSSKKIRLTSLKDDSAGGDTNGDGAGSTPTNQDWGLTFGDLSPLGVNNLSTLESVVMTYMDITTITNRKLNISSSELKTSYSGFRSKTGALLTVSCSSFSDIAHSVFIGEANSQTKVSGGSFNLSSASSDAFIFFDGASFNLDSSTVSNNTASQSVLDLFASDATINNTTFQNNQGQGFLTFNNFTETRPATLKVTNSIVKNMGREATIGFDNSQINMDSVSMTTLPMLGIGLFDSIAQLNKVTLRNGNDSGVVMFDTSDFPTTSKVTGDYLTFDNFDFTGILSFDSQADVKRSLAQASDYGAYVFMGGRAPIDETFSFTESNIINNTSFGIKMETSTPDPLYLVQATRNWWGNQTGPFHPNLNCHGLGNAVSDGVTFSPFYKNSSHTGALGTANATGCPPAIVLNLMNLIVSPVLAAGPTPLERALAIKKSALELKQQKLDMLRLLIGQK